jgi:hypothetical protein
LDTRKRTSTVHHARRPFLKTVAHAASDCLVGPSAFASAFSTEVREAPSDKFPLFPLASDDGGAKMHMYGMVSGAFLTMFVLGVRRVGPSTNRAILVEPRCGDLTHASGVAVTEFGPVDMEWSRGSDRVLSIQCNIPQNVKTLLRLHARDNNHSS